MYGGESLNISVLEEEGLKEFGRTKSGIVILNCKL